MKTDKKSRTHAARRIVEAGDKARYDNCAKNVLSNKMILAQIFHGTVREVSGRSVLEIRDMIEGMPAFGDRSDEVKDGRRSVRAKRVGGQSVSVPEAITGMDTVDKSQTDGEIDYDVLTWITVPKRKRTIKIIIDLEAQQEYHPGYDLVTRGIYYVARRISRQKDTEFARENYGDIKKVYSIWICMDAPKKYRGTITGHSIRRQDLDGVFGKTEYYDLLSVVLIRLGGGPENYMPGSLQHMLSVLFTPDMNAQEKMRILEEQYKIPMTDALGEEVRKMCNLSDGIEKRGIEKGRREGRKEGIAAGRREGIAAGRREGIEKGRKEGINERNRSIAKEMKLADEPVEKIIRYTGLKPSVIKML